VTAPVASAENPTDTPVAGALGEPPPPRLTRMAWLPSSWVLTLWTIWWLWRYAAVQALPGYGQLAWASAAGYLVDALLLDSLLALLRWRAGDGGIRGAARYEAVDPLGPKWLRVTVIALLFASAFARAADGLHCYLAHAHMDAEFWRTLSHPGRLWELRYVWLAALASGWLARVLVGKELQRAARVRAALAEIDARSGADAVMSARPRLQRFVHVDAMRAAFLACLGAWLGTVMGGASRVLVAPPEWWAFGGLVDLLFGAGG